MRRVFIHTFGCKVNQCDSQAIRDHFIDQGDLVVDTLPAADTVVINSCTVTAEADRQCRQLLRRAAARMPVPRIILTGCYARRSAPQLSVDFPHVELWDAGSFRAAPVRSFDGHARAFLKVQDGCDAFCSYCVVPFVRTVLWSRPLAETITQVKALADRGYPEIVLTGVHLGKYTGGVAALVRALLPVVGAARLRLSSLEVTEVTEDLMRLLQDEPARLCRHLHLPLQSGSDAVLARMKRGYTVEAFLRTVDAVRARVPDIGISTDLIAGFPGETDEDAALTAACVERAGLSRVHVFPYSPRPGTAAARLALLPSPVVADRAAHLRQLGERIEERFWRRFLGTRRPVVLEGTRGTMLTDNYIRLSFENKTHSKYSGIFNMTIIERHGMPWGVEK